MPLVKTISSIKEDQFTQKALVESNIERGEHGITTEETSEIVPAIRIHWHQRR